MKCKQCGACCIAPSISSPIPGMQNGKPANTRCINLDDNNRCKIFNSDKRPKVCSDYKPDREFCGNNLEEGMKILLQLEEQH